MWLILAAAAILLSSMIYPPASWAIAAATVAAVGWTYVNQ